MTTPIASSHSSYNFAVHGQGIGSIQSLLTQLRGLMGEIDQQTANIEGELRGRMESTTNERQRLDFIRDMSSGMSNISRVSEYTPAVVAAAMRAHGIDPGSNPEDAALCRQLGIHVDAYALGRTSGDVTALTIVAPGTTLDRAGVNNVMASHQSTLDELTNAMQQDSSRLQGLMNRRSEFLNTISQCMNAEHSTNASIIQNIR